MTSGPVTFSGTRLSLPESGTSLTIPEGALPKGVKEQVYLAVLREDRHRPKLRGLWTLTSDSNSDSSFSILIHLFNFKVLTMSIFVLLCCFNINNINFK